MVRSLSLRLCTNPPGCVGLVLLVNKGAVMVRSLRPGANPLGKLNPGVSVLWGANTNDSCTLCLDEYLSERGYVVKEPGD